MKHNYAYSVKQKHTEKIIYDIIIIISAFWRVKGLQDFENKGNPLE